MHEKRQKPVITGEILPEGVPDPHGVRYSLKKMMEEVVIERRDSVFGRELVDSTEIEKMFAKKKRKKAKE